MLLLFSALNIRILGMSAQDAKKKVCRLSTRLRSASTDQHCLERDSSHSNRDKIKDCFKKTIK